MQKTKVKKPAVQENTLPEGSEDMLRLFLIQYLTQNGKMLDVLDPTFVSDLMIGYIMHHLSNTFVTSVMIVTHDLQYKIQVPTTYSDVGTGTLIKRFRIGEKINDLSDPFIEVKLL